jgi:hypothetical protein
MAQPDRIEGLAIVSDDGMIADASGVQPDALKIEADQRYFRRSLDQAAVLVHGKNSGEGGPDAVRRTRLILTRQIAALAPIPGAARALLWNPEGASLSDAWDALGLSGGVLAVIGGTGPFGLFLPRYDAFHLSRAEGVRLPGGSPVFPGIPPASPEDLLTRHGLRPGPAQVLDAAAGLVLTVWRR